jgi:tRNA (guanine26-N2/guanine27-N2)-dimethyltransferase
LSFSFPTENVIEGQASIRVPKLSLYSRPGQYIPSLAPVFYNPKMKLNRDIAVLVLRVFQRNLDRPIRVAEPLAGCGIRGIRFAKEVSNIESVYLNDLNPSAASLMESNIADNGLIGRAYISNLDANTFLSVHSSPKQRFDAVDVDPYGSPSPFLEYALRALINKGLLALTATDTAPLCGVNPAACLRKYQGKPLRTEYCRELGIRLILNALTWTAARHDVGIRVLLTHATDHYLRIYIQTNRGAQRADASIGQLGYVFHCFHCMFRTYSPGVQPILESKCHVCGGSMNIAGPIWLGPLVDVNFCNEMLEYVGETSDSRTIKLLKSLVQEADAPPTFYVIDKVCDKLNIRIPPKKDVLEELKRRGHLAVETHFHPTGLKTDAPVDELGEVLVKLRTR